MKIKTYLICILLAFTAFTVKAQNTDSLQKQLDTTKNDCARLDLYTAMANNLIQFNQPQTHVISNADATKAADYVLKAIHINAKNDDTLALRNNFDCLGQAYFIQKKYTQAKWFILQSNCISRDRHDVPHIIYSLMQIATVKIAIKDYKLAEKDLQEAIVLSKYEYNVPQQIKVEKSLAALYDKQGNLKAALTTQKHYSLLADNYKKEQKLHMMTAMLRNKAKMKLRALFEPNPNLITQYEQSTETRLSVENGIWAVRN